MALAGESRENNLKKSYILVVEIENLTTFDGFFLSSLIFQCWSEFYLKNKNLITTTSGIQPIQKIKGDPNPSKIVTFLYIVSSL